MGLFTLYWKLISLSWITAIIGIIFLLYFLFSKKTRIYLITLVACTILTAVLQKFVFNFGDKVAGYIITPLLIIYFLKFELGKGRPLPKRLDGIEISPKSAWYSQLFWFYLKASWWFFITFIESLFGQRNGLLVGIVMLIAGLFDKISKPKIPFSGIGAGYSIVIGLTLIIIWIIFHGKGQAIRNWFKGKKHSIIRAVGGTKVGLFVIRKLFPVETETELENESEVAFALFDDITSSEGFVVGLLEDIKNDMGRAKAERNLLEYIAKHPNKKAVENLMGTLFTIYIKEVM
jgi:hypothetical protein